MRRSDKHQDLIKLMEKGLDDEFKKNLDIIRPHISCLSDECICLCDAWINKLLNAIPTEKYLRNKYLFALWSQLSQGVFEIPFSKFPNNGPLPLLDLQNAEWSDTNETSTTDGNRTSRNSVLHFEQEADKIESNLANDYKVMSKCGSANSPCSNPTVCKAQYPTNPTGSSIAGTSKKSEEPSKPPIIARSSRSKSTSDSNTDSSREKDDLIKNKKKICRAPSCTGGKRSRKGSFENDKRSVTNTSEEIDYYLIKDDLTPPESSAESERIYVCYREPVQTELLPEKKIYRDNLRLTKKLLDEKPLSMKSSSYYKPVASPERYREDAAVSEDLPKNTPEKKSQRSFVSDKNPDSKPTSCWSDWRKKKQVPALPPKSKLCDANRSGPQQSTSYTRSKSWIKADQEPILNFNLCPVNVSANHPSSTFSKEKKYEKQETFRIGGIEEPSATKSSGRTNSTAFKNNGKSDKEEDSFNIDSFWTRGSPQIKLTNSNGEVESLLRSTVPYSFENCLFLKNSRINMTSEADAAKLNQSIGSTNSSNVKSNSTPKNLGNISEECAALGSGHEFQSAHVDVAFKRRLAEISVIYELRARKLGEKLRVANQQNAELKDEVVGLQSCVNNVCTVNNCKIEKLKQENGLLQDKLKVSEKERDLKTEKLSIITQRIQSFQTKLNETRAASDRLIQEISQLEEKVKRLEMESNQKVEEINQKHKKECICIEEFSNEKVNLIVADYNDRLNILENSYGRELQSLKEQHSAELEKMMSDNHARVEKMRVNNEEMLIDKNMEISRLENVIHTQCTRLEAEVSSIRSRISDKGAGRSCEDLHSKVDQLQKQLEKMEKLKNKCLKCLEGKFLTLLKEKHTQEAELKSQLAKERAAITVQVFSDSQNELRDAVTRLEQRYQEIISALQEQDAGALVGAAPGQASLQELPDDFA